MLNKDLRPVDRITPKFQSNRFYRIYGIASRYPLQVPPFNIPTTKSYNLV
jgi:hypothetical protein